MLFIRVLNQYTIPPVISTALRSGLDGVERRLREPHVRGAGEEAVLLEGHRAGEEHAEFLGPELAKIRRN